MPASMKAWKLSRLSGGDHMTRIRHGDRVRWLWAAEAKSNAACKLERRPELASFAPGPPARLRTSLPKRAACHRKMKEYFQHLFSRRSGELAGTALRALISSGSTGVSRRSRLLSLHWQGVWIHGTYSRARDSQTSDSWRAFERLWIWTAERTAYHACAMYVSRLMCKKWSSKR